MEIRNHWITCECSSIEASLIHPFDEKPNINLVYSYKKVKSNGSTWGIFEVYFKTSLGPEVELCPSTKLFWEKYKPSGTIYNEILEVDAPEGWTQYSTTAFDKMQPIPVYCLRFEVPYHVFDNCCVCLH